VVFGAGEDNGQVGHNRRGSVKLAQSSRERTGIKEKRRESCTSHKKKRTIKVRQIGNKISKQSRSLFDATLLPPAVANRHPPKLTTS
jgi:hypothetical protein